MIGVDIIDLSCSFSGSKYGLEDYKRKILNPSEMDLCNDLLSLECIWAMKESAYKCHSAETGDTFFNPKRIWVTQLDLNTSRFHAEIGCRSYKGSFCITPEYIYAICFNLHSEDNQGRLFIKSGSSLASDQEEWTEFFTSPDHFTKYLLHDRGFPCAIEHKGHYYAYSRSHHGAYYISAIIHQGHT